MPETNGDILVYLSGSLLNNTSIYFDTLEIAHGFLMT